ncbi:hypothetical protein [Profundibacter sp.]
MMRNSVLLTGGSAGLGAAVAADLQQSAYVTGRMQNVSGGR